MVIMLFCLAHTFLPDVAIWAAEVEIQAAILAFGVFALILYRNRLGSSRRPSHSSHSQVLGDMKQQ
jgi:hypothetical protein